LLQLLSFLRRLCLQLLRLTGCARRTSLLQHALGCARRTSELLLLYLLLQ
jgi:hypothetical protein